MDADAPHPRVPAKEHDGDFTEKKVKKEKKERKERRDKKEKKDRNERNQPEAIPATDAGYPEPAAPGMTTPLPLAAKLSAEREAEVEETGSAGSSGSRTSRGACAALASEVSKHEEVAATIPTAAAALIHKRSRKGRLQEQSGSKVVRKTVAGEDTAIYRLHLQAQATLHNSILFEAVKKPVGIDREPWIAAKTVALFDELEQFISVLEDFCQCDKMVGGKYLVWKWKDDDAYATPTSLSPREYGRELLRFTRLKYADTTLFPPDGLNFPQDFEETMHDLHKRFFRVYAHAYVQHFHHMQNLDIEAHVNCLFKHFLYFTRQNHILSQSDIEPMKEYIERIEDQAIHDREAKLVAGDA